MEAHKDTQRTDVATFGEFKLIDHLTKDFKTYRPETLKGIGDDAAVIDLGDRCCVISTDMLVEGIHFDTAYTPLKHLGYKAVAVNLSDICAMNVLPSQITVSIALSNRYSVEALEELYAGIRAACNAFQIDLIGGDTTSSLKGLIISITAVGFAPKEQIVYRNTAKVGDLICITGDLGGAYIGLQLLEREKKIWKENPGVQPDLENQDYVIGRQLKPEPRIDVVQYFQQNKFKPTSMIDISDGLASELFHLCKQSNVGALLEESGVPIHPDTELMSIRFKLDPISAALSGGEDYELLFTVDPKDLEKVKYMPELYIAGEILDAKDGLKLNTKGGNLHDITAQGWTHF
jgi:thiamine-monophosphate kinase